ncbi:GTP 3',8-cyclase MoaA [Geitlerinema sp. PCC 9228]|uniref:GTP 3',8-cyclase MoaA n=1 Tax=Geitlerinema sp. PCC 9228 TaxID=111611 RepID=UPI0009FF15C4|nr:GTP 3',8-cyclase MoaA [Geitlerinema sp. PCC 9228]
MTNSPYHTVDYLRVSLIDRCNFQCQYCMPEGSEIDYIQSQNFLSNEELLYLLREVFLPLGFNKFRLTGGEPLLRPQIDEIVAAIASAEQTQDLAMTTNGFLLADTAQDLYDAGLRRINISLDSLDPDTFAALVGDRTGKRWEQVWAGIQAAYRVGFDPLKLNVIVIPGINDGEVLDLAALTIKRAWHVRFIEFMPIGNSMLFHEKQWIPSEQLRQQIRDRWGLTTAQVAGNGPADIFQIPGAQGTLGFISQMSECFCDRCNRMRLSADGWLRPCLLNEQGSVNLRASLRRGESVESIRTQVREVLAIKPEINFKERDMGTTDGGYARTMSQIGG